MLGWELPPYNSGGMGVVCYQLSQSLAKAGVAIQFVVPYKAKHQIDWMKVDSALDIDPYQFRIGGGVYADAQTMRLDGSSPLEFGDLLSQTEVYAQGVARKLTKYRFDVIHVHDWLTLRAGILAKQLSGKPLIVHLHATQFDQAGGRYGNSLIHEIEYMGLSVADRIIAVSQFTKDLVVKEYGIDPAKIEVVHNQINANDFSPISQANPYRALGQLKQAGYQIVSSLGRITIQKGLANFLTSFKEVVARRPKTILLLAGSGEQIRDLQVLAADLGIAANVAFTNDFVNGNKMRWVYRLADLFIMPSTSEPFGLTPLEAILEGTPALVSKQSGVSEILNNCLKVDCWDIDSMANQVCCALASPAMLAALVLNSRQEVMSMNWAKAASRVKLVYRRLQPQLTTKQVS